MRSSLSHLTRACAVALASAVTVVGLAGVASATPDPCPGGAEPCVYLAGGTYALGNPVTYSTGVGPGTRTLLTHCDSSGGNCDSTFVVIPGLSVASSSSTLLTLTVPGEGVSLSGTTPTLYLGVPTASVGSPPVGLTLHVESSTILIWDSSLNNLISAINCKWNVVPSNPYVNGTFSICGVNLTVTV
jgi:hypothetical protein